MRSLCCKRLGGKSRVALTALVLMPLPCFAQAEQSMDAKVTEASVFKNGLGFLVREAELPGPGEYVLKDLPVPVHGTFWILPDSKGTTVKEAVAFSSPRSETGKAVTLLELLKANIGKKVEVRTEKDEWFAATVVTVPEREPKLPVSLSGTEGRYYDYWGRVRAYRPPSAEAGQGQEAAGFVVLEAEEGQMLALPPSEIKGVRSTDSKLGLDFVSSRPGAALRLKVAGGGGRVRVAYLEWGLTWAPSYQVDISSPKEASLQCKAEVLNDVEDMKGATVNFITGYPNLAFAEAVDPVALLGDASDFLQSLINLGAPGRRRQTPVVAQQAVMVNAPIQEMGRPRPVVPEEGEVREDLFLYPQSDVTLQRGERGYYPLFAKRVPCDNLYLWEIEDSLDERERWRHYYGYWYERGDQQVPEQEEVWHSLRLTNTGGIPWTTAPAMTVQGGRVLGQDVLFYTSPGAKTLVKITRSIDVKAEQGEKEVDRQRNAPTPYSGDWDLITVKGELRVFNYKTKPVTMLIKKTLSGEVLETSPKPSLETTTKGVWRVNPQQLLTWELPVEASGKLYVSYKYKVYARR